MFLTGDCGSWGRYGPCSKTCGGGVQIRVRSCPPKSLHLTKQKRRCNTTLCPGQGMYPRNINLLYGESKSIIPIIGTDLFNNPLSKFENYRMGFNGGCFKNRRVCNLLCNPDTVIQPSVTQFRACRQLLCVLRINKLCRMIYNNSYLFP